jgi:predicted membrane-bound mannosyltransferase
MRYEDQTKYHRLLAFGAFALALAFRLIRLNNLALNDYEAEIALQALEAARGSGTQFGSQAAYVGLTGFLFYIFSASNFLARFLPALIGSLIIFVPLLFREQIGSWSATILAVILAISPEMVGLSRIIGSPMMAFVLLLLSLGLFIRRKPILMGIALALGLMSGEGFWGGWVHSGIELFGCRKVF